MAGWGLGGKAGVTAAPKVGARYTPKHMPAVSMPKQWLPMPKRQVLCPDDRYLYRSEPLRRDAQKKVDIPKERKQRLE